MKKIDIKNRENLTYLSIAFNKELFPSAKYGQIFFDKDNDNEIKYLYFDNEYYDSLIKHILQSEVFMKIDKSNSRHEWYELLKALRNSENFEDLDFGNVEVYYTDIKNYDPIVISEERLQQILSIPVKSYENLEELKADLKRIYIGNVNDIFKQDGVFHLHMSVSIKSEYKFNFPFKPLFAILEKHKFEIKDLELFKSSEEKGFFSGNENTLNFHFIIDPLIVLRTG